MDTKNYEMVLIESSKRDQGSSTSFNFSLSRPIKNIHRIDLLYASLNNTFYTFRSTDVFKWNEIFYDRSLGVIDIDTGEISYDLPPQHKQFYFTDSSLSIDEFADYIETNMNALTDRKEYKVTYDASNFKLIIQNMDIDNKKFELDFSHPNSIHKKAGFDKKLYEGTNYITSDTSMILNSSEYILINVNRFGSNISTKNGTGSFFIPSQSIRGDMIAYNEASNFQQTIDVVNLNLSDLHIQILDDEGTLLESDSEINLKLLLRCYKKIQM